MNKSNIAVVIHSEEEFYRGGGFLDPRKILGMKQT